MAINTETIMPIGMNRDSLIGTGNSDKYSFENLNLRYIASEDGTTGSWTTERSTKKETTLSTGTNILGQAIINDTLVLFVHSEHDYILKVYYINDVIHTDILYEGNLNFSNKIETTVSYENENIQKVYWVDGINPLRMINISKVKAASNFDTQFDVLPKLALNETVTVEKVYDGSGMFPSGTTQYFFTYVDKYGRESNIFYASSLYYNTLKDRGLNPDGSEYASCSYNINISNLDTINKFDYIRIYSVIRPVEGATPIAKIVVDLDITNISSSNVNSVFYKDTNTSGEIIDYSIILYLGGKAIIPATIEQKNNTLFLGNLRINNNYNITSSFKNAIKQATSITFETSTKQDKDADFTEVEYPFNKSLDLSADAITTFKKSVKYRFALQFQDIYGNWTEAIYINDVTNTIDNTYLNRVVAKARIDFSSVGPIYSDILSNFKKVRLLCSYPRHSDKEVVAQGILCPTMFHPAWEKTHSPDRFSSWFFRPENGNGPMLPLVTGASHKQDIEITGDYSIKIEVNSSIEHWNSYDTNQTDLLKVTINNRNLNEIFTASYSYGLEDNSLKYVQALISNVSKSQEDSIIFTASTPLYLIRLYEYDPYSLHFRPYKTGNPPAYSCAIENVQNANDTIADITSYTEDGGAPSSANNCFKITYQKNNAFISVIDDIIPTGSSTFLYNKKVIYNYNVVNTYTPSTDTFIAKNSMSFYDLDYSIPDSGTLIGTLISGWDRASFYMYNGEVLNGYGWDSKGRVTNEVQSGDSPVSETYKETDDLDSWGFYIDNKKYFTFHSPDIEYNEYIQTTNIQDYKLRIIGQVNQTAWFTDVDVDAKKSIDFNGNKDTGLFKNSSNNIYHFTDNADPVKDVNPHPGYWRGIDVYASNTEKDKQLDYLQYDYILYPYQRKYISNYVKDMDIHTDVDNSIAHISSTGEIKYKQFGVYRVFGSSIFYQTPITTENPVNTEIWVDNSYVPLRVQSDSSYIKYSGNIDDIAEPCKDQDYTCNIHKYDGLFKDRILVQSFGDLLNVNPIKTVTKKSKEQLEDVEGKLKGSYPILATKYKRFVSRKHKPKDADEDDGYLDSVDLVLEGRADAWREFLGVDSEGPQIRFKSNTHAVLNLNELTDNELLPNRETVHPSLYLAELIKPVENAYGGDSQTAIKNNIFYPCGMPVTLPGSITSYNNTSSDIGVDTIVTVSGTRGDCYYMAYDCLKTYPYSNDEINGVVEVGSFLCESYINLNGRYDKYIGHIEDVIGLDKTKFGLINLGYTQNKDLFSYHVIDDDDSNLINYPNQITWTKTKTPGEIVDTWTNITLANVANAEGTMGKIISLNAYNDNLIMFQEHGIARIGYNEKTAISTENGIPLEIASSNKFTGFSYISKEIGCQNKWTINISKNGLMFIDTSRKELNVVSDTIIPLSTKHGFDSFFIKELDIDPDFTTYYDKLSKDIYYLNTRCCLAFNEVSSTFTSFYSYEDIKALATISNHSIVVKNNCIWALREGSNYSNYFDESKPYKMVICCDGTKYFQTDKVFNTVETRSDIFNPDSIGSTVEENPFDTIAAWDSYQKPTDFSLDGTDTLYEWPASKKYNIWRYVVPRATYDDESITFDRIRNPFAFIKVERKIPSGNRAIIHDMVVYYDIK